MANYITTTFGLNRILTNLMGTGAIPSEQEQIETTSNKTLQNTQDVGTSHEVLVINDMTDNCMVLLKNLHTTAIVQVGVVVAATFYPLFSIPPGERSKMSRATALANIYLLSDTASTEVEVSIYKIV